MLFVDGDHSQNGARADLLNMRAAAAPHATGVAEKACQAAFEAAAPGQFRPPGHAKALFAGADGRALAGLQVQSYLRLAAKREGLCEEDNGSHSLRFGGASTLWNAFGDSGLVQRMGRWASSCFQGYIWESRAAAQGVADRMIQADDTLV